LRCRAVGIGLVDEDMDANGLGERTSNLLVTKPPLEELWDGMDDSRRRGSREAVGVDSAMDDNCRNTNLGQDNQSSFLRRSGSGMHDLLFAALMV
jgi:hypothetical protein